MNQMWIRLKSHLKTGGIFLVGLVVLDLALAQAAKRIMPKWRGEIMKQEASILTPPYHHGRKPYADFIYRYGDWQSTYYTNSLGFRDASPRTVPLKSDKYRVMIIGDSITEGTGVPYEQTFVGIIARKLEAKGIETLNAAVERYAHQIYYAKVRHFVETVGLEVNEVVVIADIGDMANDVGEHRTDDRGHVVSREKLKYGRVKRFKFWLKDNSVLYRLYRKYRDGEFETPRRKRQGAFKAVIKIPGIKWTVDRAEYDDYAEEGMAIAEQVMTKLAAFLSERNIKLTIVVFPHPIQILKKDLDSLHVKFWRDWTTRNKADFINLFPEFINNRDPEEIYRDLYIPFDFHFNPKGHAFFASSFLKGYATGLYK